MNEPQKALVAALRSGEYKQAKHVLCSFDEQDKRFCCLGVACDLYQKMVGGLKITETEHNRRYNDHGQDLPAPVMVWLGFYNSIGVIDENRVKELQTLLNEKGLDKIEPYHLDTLAELNDNGTPFDVIADIIEKGLVRSNGE